MRLNPRLSLCAGLLILDFYESWDDLSPDYSLTFLLIWVENWWCMVTTLGCAIVHYLWSRVSCVDTKCSRRPSGVPLTLVLLCVVYPCCTCAHSIAANDATLSRSAAGPSRTVLPS